MPIREEEFSVRRVRSNPRRWEPPVNKGKDEVFGMFHLKLSGCRGELEVSFVIEEVLLKSPGGVRGACTNDWSEVFIRVPHKEVGARAKEADGEALTFKQVAGTNRGPEEAAQGTAKGFVSSEKCWCPLRAAWGPGGADEECRRGAVGASKLKAGEEVPLKALDVNIVEAF